MITYPNGGRVPSQYPDWEPDDCTCGGRNGFSYCAGISVYDRGNRIRIYPVTRQRMADKANTFLELPRTPQAIDALCAELQAMKRPVRKSDPTLDGED